MTVSGKMLTIKTLVAVLFYTYGASYTYTFAQTAKSKSVSSSKQHTGDPPPTPSSGNSMQTTGFCSVNGIFPSLTAVADSAPNRSESGIGALMPWADKLYMVSYLSVPEAGNGTGLFEIDSSMNMRKIANHRSTFANRLLHRQSNQIIIGAWLIDSNRTVRAFTSLVNVRVAATAEHLTDPDNKVYMLGMDGPLWECNVHNLSCTQLFDLVTTLGIPANLGEQPHFKAAHTMNGRLIVASNTFEEADFLGYQTGGRLAEWHGPGSDWTIIERSAFVEVTGRRNFGKVIYALGWDNKSVILKVFVGDSEANNLTKTWQTYRLPKASHAYDHLWQTEWPRIREVETERYLMDMHGMFYELSPLGWAGSTWGVRPVSQHLRMIPDFASFRGMLVLGGNQVSSIFDNNVVTGQAQSGLWFGKTDDLWQFGKPKGWGAVWRRDFVDKPVISDPYLMTGFDKKVLHIIDHEYDPSLGAHPACIGDIDIEIDITGGAGHVPFETWMTYQKVLETERGMYLFHVFPDGFSAHWIRLRILNMRRTSCHVTAYFHYT